MTRTPTAMEHAHNNLISHMDPPGPPPNTKRLAEAVRKACLRAAKEGYEDARIRGLCREGAWECALGAIESLEVQTVVEEIDRRQSTAEAQD